MAHIYQNPNPDGKKVDDCVIRAISIVTGKSWDDIFWELSIEAFLEKDLLNSNVVWGKYLIEHGFTRYFLPDTCPVCYTVRDFVRDNPNGIFVVGDGSHVIAIVDGNYVDAFDSGDYTVLNIFKKEIRDGNES